MTLSDIGEIVNQNIQNVSAFKDDVLIQKSVIMPNHIHLIIELKNESKSAEPPQSQSKYGHLSPLKKGSLGSFVNHFKGKITRTCRENGLIDFKWQARFHDRIIRDEEEYNRIYYYIEHNVKNWERDKEHPLNNQK
ncbi:MAG: hypothetical protein H6607_00925 [Flavobacteriales bacterium]|nr:hypothetical protein [Flavobacteriales bacterium]